MRLDLPQGDIGGAGGTSVAWIAFLSQVSSVLTAITLSGTTAQRPPRFLWVGRNYFDRTLGFMIWYNGTAWVNATGAPV